MCPDKSGSQGHVPNLEEVLHVRNAMVGAQDLRQPQNLDTQLLQESGLSQDVGLAMLNLLQVRVGPIRPSTLATSPFSKAPLRRHMNGHGRPKLQSQGKTRLSHRQIKRSCRV